MHVSLLITSSKAFSFKPVRHAFQATHSSTKLNLFDNLSKINPFEESGMLGKGITVGKIQIALASRDRSICKSLESLSNGVEGDDQGSLADFTNEVCLTLLRNSADWVGACSASEWFSGNDAGKAERLHNEWANKEASKFEKEYIPAADDDTKPEGATTVVISLVVEIQGDSTNFDGAGFSLSGTKEVLTSLASDVLVEEGCCLNASEIFWCPSDPSEVLSKRDVIMDFPEIVDL